MTTTRDTAATALTRFDHAWATLDKTVQGLSERELTEIRDPAGWSAKDHLMHVATWEQALLAKLDGRARHEALGLDASTDGSENWDALNASIFAATRDRSLRDVLDTVRGTHATTRAQIVALADGGATPAAADGFLSDVPGYADHYEQHDGWIRELIGRV
jgi:DinB superfamily